MEKIFELNDIESKLHYIQSVAPSVLERIQTEIKREDISELKKDILIDRAVSEAFDISGKDAIITMTMNTTLGIRKYLTKKAEVHIDGKYKLVWSHCFSYCPFLETIVFEEGVEGIAEQVLCNNFTVKKIACPKTLKYIGASAFKNCVNLNEVVLLNPQTWISPSSFEGTKWFEQFTEDFVVVNGQLLKYNGNEEDITIPEGIVHISANVFYENKKVKTVTCPSTLEDIWTFSFANCTNLRKVIFNNTLNIISIGAFENCPNLTEVTLPKSLTLLGAMAFNRSTVIRFYDTNQKLSEHIKSTYPRHTILD